MRPMLLVLFLAGCSGGTLPEDTADTGDPGPVTVRFATFNSSLHRDTEGRLVSDLAGGTTEQAVLLAAIIQQVRPDVLLLNEVDWDSTGAAVDLLRSAYLEVSQQGGEPISYDHVLVPTVNTGVSSGYDLDNNGQTVTTPGIDAYGDDSLGFGVFPGQYGMVVLSRYPIAQGDVRTFQHFRWRDLPDAWLPDGWYSTDELGVLPLSSKTHADVPIEIGDHTVHFLVSHPTPPTFDGSEDRNGRRNHDEIRFWAEYIDAPGDWVVDDEGGTGGLDGQPFVLAGDLNADPLDGDSSGDPMAALLGHSRVQGAPVPTSAGGAEQASLQGGANASHQGDPAQDTADFNDNSPGNLRLDYVLPSVDLPIEASGVFWPAATDPAFAWVGTYPFPVSDHRLVWVDVAVGAAR